jgi:HEAT repeat protein
LRYAESSDRLIYAFVFGSSDTCRVIRRPSTPQRPLEFFLRRPPGASFRGASGDSIIKEFTFGSVHRPVHIVPSNDGKHLVTFANRAPDGSRPRQDRILVLEEGSDFEPLDYGGLPVAERPEWPRLPRALARARPTLAESGVWSYGFLVEETYDGALLVARQSEGGENAVKEMVCFAIRMPNGKVELPTQKELTRLLKHAEPLYRAGAAWALGARGDRSAVPALKAALGGLKSGPARAVVARAMVRCGDKSGRRVLRSLLGDEKDPPARAAAALAIAQLPPDRTDADALASTLADESDETWGLAGVALARLGRAGLGALIRSSRSSRVDLRKRAARVLGRMDEPDAERRLLAMARDTAVQTAVAIALTAPPRTILPQHHEDFARALEACGRARNQTAARRLSTLAAHARIHHEKVLKALVDLASFEPKAIWSLSKLTGSKLETPEDCRTWWQSQQD